MTKNCGNMAFEEFLRHLKICGSCRTEVYMDIVGKIETKDKGELNGAI